MTNLAMSGVVPSFIWFDYSCVPQDDNDAKLKHLYSIPNILKRCHIVVLPVCPINKQLYCSSVWCVLEYIVQKNVVKFPDAFVKEDDLRMLKLSIFNPDDLYRILPGFLEMVCSPRFRIEFLNRDIPFKAEVFARVLQHFLDHHASKQANTVVAKEDI